MTGIILMTCSGISSTGRLTFYAANYFIQRSPGVFEKQIPASDINAREKEIFRELKIVVLEGCTDCCSCKN
ncbi:MAG: putative zinc-binding protein [Methanomicrobium sp.]|nr:putative zinc-binding protein [Methanomicrobium sp.]